MIGMSGPQDVISIDTSIRPSTLLDQIRPAWKSKRLIQRVVQLVQVDPSSAVQRLFNASIWDLREKMVTAGIDIAQEAAALYKLPPIQKVDDILDEYSTSNVIQLAYRMGILSRSEMKRLSRCYEIRRDLEHEDDEYEAAFEDVVYIFKTCIEVVLSKDPVDVIRVADIIELIAQPQHAVPSPELVKDYSEAPEARQFDILKELVFQKALDSSQPELIRQNAVEILRALAPLSKIQAKVKLAQEFQSRLGTRELHLVHAIVAYASGIGPYIKKRQLRQLYKELQSEFQKVGHNWKQHAEHAQLLGKFVDIGGFELCPEELLEPYCQWMVLCYIGEPGGYGDMGRNRKVFYSNVGAIRVKEILSGSRSRIQEVFDELLKSANVTRYIVDKYVQRRLDELIEAVHLVE
ncbi:MAG: hypothetical protein KJZ53_05590 [Anaerolineales bacterium]|nr:hypothetical protein [Anaerolineales bacterium]